MHVKVYIASWHRQAVQYDVYGSQVTNALPSLDNQRRGVGSGSGSGRCILSHANCRARPRGLRVRPVDMEHLQSYYTASGSALYQQRCIRLYLFRAGGVEQVCAG